MPVLNAAQMADLQAKVIEIVRKHCPYDTGNLSRNAIQVHYDAESIVLEVNDAIAPYMPYTNEPWVSPKWNGAKNPNQNWFDSAFFEILGYIASKYGGTISRSDDAHMTIGQIDAFADLFNVDPMDILENSIFLSDIQYSATDMDSLTGEYRMNYPSGVIPATVTRRIR